MRPGDGDGRHGATAAARQHAHATTRTDGGSARARPALPAPAADLPGGDGRLRAPDGAPPAGLRGRAEPATVTDQPERRFDALDPLRHRPGPHVPRPATPACCTPRSSGASSSSPIGTADRVTLRAGRTRCWRGRWTAGCGGCCCRSRTCWSLSVLGGGRLGALPPHRDPPAPPDALTRRPHHPAADRRRWCVTELLAEAFRLGRYGDPDAAWAFVAERRSAVRLQPRCSASVLEAGYAVFFWANIAARSRTSWSTCRAPSTSTSSPRSSTPRSASSRRAASCRPWTSRRETRTLRREDDRRTSAGRTCSTASPAPSAAAARTPARPGPPASRSTPRR